MRSTSCPKLDKLFLDRQSVRAFADRPVPEEALMTLFEAARWAPSCFNEQPWFFVYGTTESLLPVIGEGNQGWAKSAPTLMVLFAKRRFDRNDKDNRWASFDAGSAWMSLALQAHMLGLSAHAMGGFDPEKAYEVCGVAKEDYEACCAIAVGYPDETKEPSSRQPIQDMVKKLS